MALARRIGPIAVLQRRSEPGSFFFDFVTAASPQSGDCQRVDTRPLFDTPGWLRCCISIYLRMVSDVPLVVKRRTVFAHIEGEIE